VVVGHRVTNAEMQLPWCSNGRLVDLTCWLCAHLGTLPVFYGQLLTRYVLSLFFHSYLN